MLDKSVLNKIQNLEKEYPVIDVEKTKKEIEQLINWLEDYFGYSIRDRIVFSKFDYINTEDPERTLFDQLTIDELRVLVDNIEEYRQKSKS